MAGLYFEDFEEGTVYDHEVRRTVSEYDNTLFTGGVFICIFWFVCVL